MAKFLRFGNRPARKTGWIALANKDLNTQINGDLLIGRECQFLSEIEQEIAEIKSDLDEILRAARQHMPPAK